MIQEERVRALNDRKIRKGRYVLYWMQASQRAEYNHALEHAIALGGVGVTFSACLGVGGLGAMIVRDILSTTPTSVPTSPAATEAAPAGTKTAPTATSRPTSTSLPDTIKTSTPVPTMTSTVPPSSTGALVDTPAPPALSLKEDS